MPEAIRPYLCNVGYIAARFDNRPAYIGDTFYFKAKMLIGLSGCRGA